MTGRDRIVLIAIVTLAVLAAAWFALVSPERKQASSLGTQVSAAKKQLASAEEEASNARAAQQRYSAAYTSVVSLGKAVPPSEEVPSLIFQLAQASNQKHVEFSSITSGSSASSTSSGSSSSASATPAAAVAGFTKMPFTFIFNGSFADLYHLFKTLNGATVRTYFRGPAGEWPPADLAGHRPPAEVGRKGFGFDADGHGHRDRLRAAQQPGPDGRVDVGLAVVERRHDRLQLLVGLERAGRARRHDRRRAMNELLESVKADLLDRRLRPALALVVLALVGALAYAALGGGSSESSPNASNPLPAAKTPGISVSEANTSAEQPIAETANGSSEQTGGRTRNPFASVPGAGAKAASASSSTSGSTGSASASGSSESGAGSSASGSPAASPEASSGSGSQPQGESKPSSPTGGSSPSGKNKSEGKSSPQTAYDVSVLFGTAAPGTPVLSAQLTPYNGLKRQQPLPSSAQPVLVFRGVVAGGKSATFTIVGEAIPRGSGACLPSSSQCQAIDLHAGETEELEFLPPEGAAVNYLLQVVSIKPVKASKADAHSAFQGESKAGVELLRGFGLSAVPDLRYSRTKGVLVFAGHPAFVARAHLAAWGAALKG